MMSELLSPYLHIVIGSYRYHFNGGCDVRFFEEHRDLAETIPPLRQHLDRYWGELLKQAESRPSKKIESRSVPGNIPESKVALQRYQGMKKAKSVPSSKLSFDDQREKAQDLRLGGYFDRLTAGFDTIFPVRTVEASAVIYRTDIITDNPEVDVFDIYTWGSNKKCGLKFRVYYNIFAEFLGSNTSKEEILNMLPHITTDKPRRGRVDNKEEWYFEGYFISTKEIDRLLNTIVAKKKRV